MNEANKVSKEATATFRDQNPSYTYAVDSVIDPTRMNADMNDADLNSFFARPLKIASYTWSQSVNFYQTLNPWTLYFENPRVINRITNYGLMRAKLCVKIVINGNGFFYGRLIASYNPRHTVDDLTQDRAFFIQDVVAASQRPHIYLDPTTNQGGTMCLPFFWEDNYLEVPDAEWRNMGEMKIHTMQQLKHANGATDAVTISVFAWAEDVSLAIPTSTDATGLVPQIGEFKPQADEYGTGPVSKPASTVARIAGMLTSAPVIGPFAKATQMAASAISGIASIFGYSRPNNVKDIEYYRPVVMGNLANANVNDTCQKLTVDCKQELTVDSRTAGLDGTDELCLKSIATRESFLTNFPWAVSDAAEAGLFEISVTPMMWSTLATASDTEIHLPACAFAALPFRTWYGSMKYRFQVVASNYHKGRLKIVYDPHGFSTNEYNTNYTYIVDIAESKDFTVEIGWASDKGYCVVNAPGQGATTELGYQWSAAPLPGFVPSNNANGVLRVYVVNELTTPNSTPNNDVEINIFVSAGDDIQFRCPTERLETYSWFREQLGEFSPQMAELTEAPMGDMEETTQPDIPLSQAPDIVMNSTVSDSDHYSDVFYGEEITSARQMLKRYCLHSTVADRNTAASKLWATVMNAFPYLKGYAPGAIYATSAPVVSTFNLSYMTYMNYFTPAYAGRRGGVKWKINVGNSSGHAPMGAHFMVTRLADAQPYATSQSTLSASNPITFTKDMWDHSLTTVAGAAETNLAACPTLEVEIPYQQNLRFSPAKRANFTTETTRSDGFQTEVVNYDNNGENNIMFQRMHVAAGEDFSLFWFLGAPVIYWNVGIPTIP